MTKEEIKQMPFGTLEERLQYDKKLTKTELMCMIDRYIDIIQNDKYYNTELINGLEESYDELKEDYQQLTEDYHNLRLEYVKLVTNLVLKEGEELEK